MATNRKYGYTIDEVLEYERDNKELPTLDSRPQKSAPEQAFGTSMSFEQVMQREGITPQRQPQQTGVPDIPFFPMQDGEPDQMGPYTVQPAAPISPFPSRVQNLYDQVMAPSEGIGKYIKPLWDAAQSGYRRTNEMEMKDRFGPDWKPPTSESFNQFWGRNNLTKATTESIRTAVPEDNWAIVEGLRRTGANLVSMVGTLGGPLLTGWFIPPEESQLYADTNELQKALANRIKEDTERDTSYYQGRPWQKYFHERVTGATASIAQMLAMSKLPGDAMANMIGGGGVVEYQNSWQRGKELGLNDDEASEFAFKSAFAETLPPALFSMVGLNGAEGLVAGLPENLAKLLKLGGKDASKALPEVMSWAKASGVRSIWQAMKVLGVSTLEEMPEETWTSIWQEQLEDQINESAPPKTAYDWLRVIADTNVEVLMSTLTLGMPASINAARATRQEGLNWQGLASTIQDAAEQGQPVGPLEEEVVAPEPTETPVGTTVWTGELPTGMPPLESDISIQEPTETVPSEVEAPQTIIPPQETVIPAPETIQPTEVPVEQVETPPEPVQAPKRKLPVPLERWARQSGWTVEEFEEDLDGTAVQGWSLTDGQKTVVLTEQTDLLPVTGRERNFLESVAFDSTKTEEDRFNAFNTYMYESDDDVLRVANEFLSRGIRPTGWTVSFKQGPENAHGILAIAAVADATKDRPIDHELAHIALEFFLGERDYNRVMDYVGGSKEKFVSKYQQVNAQRRVYERGLSEIGTPIERMLYNAGKAMRNFVGNVLGKSFDQIAEEIYTGEILKQGIQPGRGQFKESPLRKTDEDLEKQRKAEEALAKMRENQDQEAVAQLDDSLEQLKALLGRQTQREPSAPAVETDISEYDENRVTKPKEEAPVQEEEEGPPLQIGPPIVPEGWNDYEYHMKRGTEGKRFIVEQAKRRGVKPPNQKTGRTVEDVARELRVMNQDNIGAQDEGGGREVRKGISEGRDAKDDAIAYVYRVGLRVPEGNTKEDFGRLARNTRIWVGKYKKPSKKNPFSVKNRRGSSWDDMLGELSEMVPDVFHKDMNQEEFGNAIYELTESRGEDIPAWTMPLDEWLMDEGIIPDTRPKPQEATDEDEQIPFTTEDDQQIQDEAALLLDRANGDQNQAWHNYESMLNKAAQAGEPVDRRRADRMREALLGRTEQGDLFGEPEKPKERRSTFKQPAERPVQQSLEGLDDGGLFTTEDRGTPEFKQWFKNSKVVDADGKPLVVYRGHEANRNVWESKLSTPTFVVDKQVARIYANDYEDGVVTGAYLNIKNPLVLTEDDYGDMTADDLLEIITKLGGTKQDWESIVSAGQWTDDDSVQTYEDVIKNPKMFAAHAYDIAESPILLKLAQKAGHDGYIFRGFFTDFDMEDDRMPLEYRPFSSAQIRSASDGGLFTTEESTDDERYQQFKGIFPNLVKAFAAQGKTNEQMRNILTNTLQEDRDLINAWIDRFEEEKRQERASFTKEKKEKVDESDIMQWARIKVKPYGEDEIELTGNTFYYRKILQEAGGVYNGDNKKWYLSKNNEQRLRELLTERKRNDDDARRQRLNARRAEMERIRRERNAESGISDERRSDEDARGLVSLATESLIRVGEEHGIKKSVIDEQLADIGLTLDAFDRGKKLMVIANAPGMGKTYVLGGIIQDLRNRGQKKFLYVTKSQPLIKQIKTKDLKNFDLTGVEFVTYDAIRTLKPNTEGMVVLWDEGHLAKSPGSQTGRAARPMYDKAVFNVLSSATPFENPGEVEYVARTGIFDDITFHDDFRNLDFTGFNAWLALHGGQVRGPGQVIWGRGDPQGSKDAWQWLTDRGILTSRMMHLEKDQQKVSLHKVKADPHFISLFHRLVVAIQNTSESFGIPAWAVNRYKMVLERAKVKAAIERAKYYLDEGKSVVIFTETKSPTWLGRFHKSGDDNGPLYTYPEMLDMYSEWQAIADEARRNFERVPKPPFAEFIMEIAGALYDAGIDEKIDSVAEQIVSELGKYGAGIYNGSVTEKLADVNLQRFMSGQYKLLIATMDKGGTGLSLHDEIGTRPTVQINLNLPWKGTKTDQVMGRVTRLGQKSQSITEWLFSDDISFEAEHLVPRLATRLSDMGAVVKGEVSELARTLAEDFDFDEEANIIDAIETDAEFTTEEYKSFDSDIKKILKQQLKLYPNTNWSKAVESSAKKRKEIEDVILKGKTTGFEHLSIRLQGEIAKHGVEGLWEYVRQTGFIGNAAKPVVGLNGSTRSCIPSEQCSMVCYACTGRFVAPLPQQKAELTDALVSLDPERAGQMISEEYKRKPHYLTGKALRGFVIGDSSPAWVRAIKVINDNGIRMHLFSKIPGLLGQISDMNLRLLSIDNTNYDLAEGNDFKVAFTYTGADEEVQWIKNNVKRIGVILPLFEKGRRLVTDADMDKLPVQARRHMCPIDSGKMSIKEDGWTCHSCDNDKNGVGCYLDNTTSRPDLTLTEEEKQLEPIFRSMRDAYRQTRGKRAKERFIERLSRLAEGTRGNRVGRGTTKGVRGSDESREGGAGVDEQAGEAEFTTEDEFGTPQGYKIRTDPPPKRTVTMYMLRRAVEGTIRPLYVNAGEPIALGKWIDATEGPAGKPRKTGGPTVQSELGELAFRPGFHASEIPLATHIGARETPKGRPSARRNSLPYNKWGSKRPTDKVYTEVFVEVEMDADKDYSPEVIPGKGLPYLPKNGMYEFRTNESATGRWFIGGSIKVNRVLTEQQVNDILKEKGYTPMPWEGGPLDLRTVGFPEDGAEFTTEDDGDVFRYPVALPELAHMVNSMLGQYPAIRRRMQAEGTFTRKYNRGGVNLRADIFIGPSIHHAWTKNKPTQKQIDAHRAEMAQQRGVKLSEIIVRVYRNTNEHVAGWATTTYLRNEKYAGWVLAHELGHAEDWLPDKNMERGNLLGRIAKLNSYMKATLAETGNPEDALTSGERARLKNKARKEARKIYRDGPEQDNLTSELYRQYVNDTVQERGLFNLNDLEDIEGIRTELVKISEAWRGPMPSKKDNPSHYEYRMSSKELYADAMSMLLNDPERTGELAPQFMKAFNAFLNKRPEFMSLYTEIQNDIAKGVTTEVRLERDLDMMANDAKVRDNAQRLKNAGEIAPTSGELWRKLVYHFFDVSIYLPTMEAQQAFQDIAYAPAKLQQYMRDIHQGVYNVLDEMGVSHEEFGTFLMRRRAAGERAMMANPLLVQGSDAEALLHALEKRVGPDGWAAIEKAADALWAARQKHIIPLLEESDAYTKELMDKINENEEYVTFQVAEYFSQHYGSASARIFPQYGTAKEIVNPFYSTLAKDSSLLWAAQTNIAKKKIIEEIRKYGNPGDITNADTEFNGRFHVPIEPPNPAHGLITYMDKGKIKGVWVRREIADMFTNESKLPSPWFQKFDYVTGIYKSAYTANNPFFATWNVQRDFRSTLHKIPTKGGIHEVFLLPSLFYSYAKTLNDAFKHAFLKQSTPLMRTLLEQGLVIADRQWTARDLTSQEEYERLRVMWALDPDKAKNILHRGAQLVLHDYNQMVEVWGKAAGYEYMQRNGLVDQYDMRDIMRGIIGSPDFLRRGEYTRFTNQIFMYSNAAAQAMEAEWRAIKRDPMTYFMRRFAYTIVPSLIMAYLRFGPDDDDDESWVSGMKKIARATPDWDFNKLICLPISLKDGVVTYIPLPQDHMGEAIHGILMSIFSDEPIIQRAWKSAIGVMPLEPSKLHPLLELGRDMLSYVQGIPPYDYFKMQRAVDDQIWQAGGWKKHEEFLKWEWNQQFGSVFGSFAPPYSTRPKTYKDWPVVKPFLRRLVRTYEIREPYKASSPEHDRALVSFKEYAAKAIRKADSKWDVLPGETFRKWKEYYTEKYGKEPQDISQKAFEGSFKRLKENRWPSK